MFGRLTRRYSTWHARRTARQQCEAAIGRLRLSGHPLAVPLAAAVSETAAGRPTPEDEPQLRRIEALRDRLVNCSELLQQLDYGAGDPEAPRDREQARGGVSVKVEVRRLAERASKDHPWSDLLYNLVRRLRPTSCLEMGTCLGLSAAQQCAALARNGGGRLLTLEGAPVLAERAEQHLGSLGFRNFEVVVGPFEQTLRPSLQRIAPVDFLFNDGHHDGEALAAYFEQSLPFLRPGSVVLFDDIAAYETMRDGWRRVSEHPAVDLVLDFGQMGLVAVGKGGDGQERLSYTLPLA